MSNPRLNPVILLSPVEDGYIAYDPVLDRLHQLNPVAALLAELCDGSRSVEDVRTLASPLVEAGKEAEIDRWIEDGLKVGLLISEGSEITSAQELPAAELTRLAKHLKYTGKVQTAYLCIKRSVELRPNDWESWYEVGELALCVGRRDEARVGYQKYFDNNSDDGEIEHLLIALRDDAPPPRASDRAIQHIYKNFAASYETRMVDDLKYVGPDRLRDGLNAVIGDKGNLEILDLGCGSGLAGMMIKPRAAHLTGVDLSPEMLELARARNIYDKLEVGEITEWLNRSDSQFDLIMSCDCLIYFADLGAIVGPARRRLKPGGLLVMSMERGNRHPYSLTDTGRYTHHPQHVQEVAAKYGMDVVYIQESFLRMEYSDEVMGLYAILQIPK